MCTLKVACFVGVEMWQSWGADVSSMSIKLGLLLTYNQLYTCVHGQPQTYPLRHILTIITQGQFCERPSTCLNMR